MLKIWLTWLQPSLGVLGMVLFLASPFYSMAAPKPTTANRTIEATKSQSVVAGADSVPTGTDLTGIAATPDLAVRQLAIGALNSSNVTASAIAAKNRQQSNRAALDNFLTPSTPKVTATQTSKPKFVKRAVASALARTVKAKITVPVTGLFIGNSEVPVASRFSPNTTRSIQPIATNAEIGAPTPLSAMMSASKAVSPYPVVRPELMQKLAKTPALANTLATQALNPIATIPSSVKQAQPPLKPLATMPSTTGKPTQSIESSTTTKLVTTKLNPAAVHSLDPLVEPLGTKIAKIPSGFHQEVPHSLDPIAAIPTGLQRLLGNNLNDNRPVAPVRVAKVNAPKTNPVKANSLLALNNLIAPVTTPEVASSGASLKLATAQAYVNVPKFDIPGERLATVTLAKPATITVLAKKLPQAALVVTVQRQDNYISFMTVRKLESQTKQSWALIGRRNNLGGLILGEQPETTLNNRIGLRSTTEVKTTGSRGVSGIQQSPIN